MARKRTRQTITLQKGPDGSWHEPGVIQGAYVTDPDLTKTSPFLPRSPAEIRTLQQMLGLKVPPEGVDVKPSLASRLFVYEHPPVPGSVGKWLGKGTRVSPYHWVGVSERVVAYAVAAAILVWGVEVIGTDISNWWSGSVISVEQDVTGLGQDILQALGIPTSVDSQGKVTAAGARQHAPFWTWVVQQLAVQGSDLEAATNSVNQLSTGFPSGGGVAGPPPS